MYAAPTPLVTAREPKMTLPPQPQWCLALPCCPSSCVRHEATRFGRLASSRLDSRVLTSGTAREAPPRSRHATMDDAAQCPTDAAPFLSVIISAAPGEGNLREPAARFPSKLHLTRLCRAKAADLLHAKSSSFRNHRSSVLHSHSAWGTGMYCGSTRRTDPPPVLVRQHGKNPDRAHQRQGIPCVVMRSLPGPHPIHCTPAVTRPSFRCATLQPTVSRRAQQQQRSALRPA